MHDQLLLILLGDTSFSNVFFSCFWILFHNSAALLLNISVYLSYKSFEVTLCRTSGFIVKLIWGKTKSCIKTDSGKLLKYLLTNKIFSKQIFSWNFKMELCLNREVVWEFLGWKLIILTAFFVKLQSVEYCYDSEPRQDRSRISRSQK